MKLKLICPEGVYDGTQKINCKVSGGRCAHIRYMPCKGWYVQTEQARDCPGRKGGDKSGNP